MYPGGSEKKKVPTPSSKKSSGDSPLPPTIKKKFRYHHHQKKFPPPYHFQIWPTNNFFNAQRYKHSLIRDCLPTRLVQTSPKYLQPRSHYSWRRAKIQRTPYQPSASRNSLTQRFHSSLQPNSGILQRRNGKETRSAPLANNIALDSSDSLAKNFEWNPPWSTNFYPSQKHVSPSKKS